MTNPISKCNKIKKKTMKKFNHINKTSSKNWNKNTLPRTLGFEVWRTKNTSYNAKNLGSPNPSIPKSNTYFTSWVSHNAKNQPNHLKSTTHRAKSKSHSYPFHHRTQDSNPHIGPPDHPKLGVTTHDFSEVVTSKTSSPRSKMMEARNPLPLSRSHLTQRFVFDLTSPSIVFELTPKFCRFNQGRPSIVFELLFSDVENDGKLGVWVLLVIDSRIWALLLCILDLLFSPIYV